MIKNRLIAALLIGAMTISAMGCTKETKDSGTDDEAFEVFPEEDPDAKEKEEITKTPRRSDRVNADEYLSDNGSVLEQMDINASASVQSEKDVIEMLYLRGFKTDGLSYSYDMDGKFLGDKPADTSSDALHPTYQMYHMAGSGQSFFTISVINGQITALPVYHNLNSENTAKVIFSESSELFSYDSATNQFYKSIPSKNVLDVRVIDRIDADSLEKLAKEGF